MCVDVDMGMGMCVVVVRMCGYNRVHQENWYDGGKCACICVRACVRASGCECEIIQYR